MLNELFRKVNDQDQYIKLWNLLIHKLDDVPDKKGADFSEWVADKINELLPSLNGSINKDDIDRSHVFHKKSKAGKKIIIVRFISRDKRNKVLSCRRDLKGSGIMITEHLNGMTLDLLKAAKDSVGFRNAWTYEGKVYISYHSRKIQINSDY